MSVKLRSHLAFLAAWTALLVAAHCQDPVVYVPGMYCPDQNGHAGPDYPWTRFVAGNICCADQGIAGGGQCPENTSCMSTDTCSSPLPPNDSTGFESRAPTKRMGLE